MNYSFINKSILFDKEIEVKNVEETTLYRYLINNSVAFFFYKNIRKNRGNLDSAIEEKVGIFQERYYRTLRLLYEISSKKNFDFILFKTYKHIPEVVDGDIDIFIKKEDFDNWVAALEKLGFNTEMVGQNKVECTKETYNKVEPRVSLEFNEFVVFDESKVWTYYENKEVGDLPLKITTLEFDVVYHLLNLFLGPNYFKLYAFKLYLLSDKKKLEIVVEEVKDFKVRGFIKRFINTTLESKRVARRKFPITPSLSNYLKWWAFYYLKLPDIKFIKKIKNLLFYFYLKIMLRFNKAYFSHRWF